MISSKGRMSRLSNSKIKVLVGCEFSGVVRQAFRKLGFDAWSCDLLPAEDGSKYHIQGDVFDAIKAKKWDLAIFHPPCTFLAVSGARWFKFRRDKQEAALEFVRKLLAAPIPFIALENPVSIISSRIRKPDCTCQPWEHGDPYSKRICLWLKNLPPLKPTKIMAERKQECWLQPPGPDRWKNRSRTYPGPAKSMAKQWGKVLSDWKNAKGLDTAVE